MILRLYVLQATASECYFAHSSKAGLQEAPQAADSRQAAPLPGWLKARQAQAALAAAHPSSIPSLNSAFDTFLALYLLRAGEAGEGRSCGQLSCGQHKSVHPGGEQLHAGMHAWL